MNSDRLAALHLLPPLPDSVWATNPMTDPQSSIARAESTAIKIELPLFWYQPPWLRMPDDVAGRLAASVANLDVAVAALRRDLSRDEEPCELFAPVAADADDPEPGDTLRYLPRITPYRAERYGILPQDFDNSLIIDVHLASTRDVSGRLAYSPDQMKRWERGLDDAAIGGGGFVASGTFPADVVSLTQLQIKLKQLRQLAPTAAVFVSIDCYRLDQEVAAALVSQPDGLIVRMQHPDLEGIQLAALVHRARRLMQKNGCGEKPLWIVPGEVTARDVAKLIALGASAVAIDHWCNPLVDFLLESMPTSRYDRTAFNEIPALASQHLWDDIDHVIGHVSAISPQATTAQRLGTYHSRWSKACGASLLLP